MKRASLSILFLALLLLSSVAVGRQLVEDSHADKYKGFCGLCIRHGVCCADYCCPTKCCSKEEYAEFLKGTSVPQN